MKNFYIFIFSALFFLSCATDSFGIYHTVKKGENLNKISQLYNVDENEIRQQNSLSEETLELKEGSSIFIPGAEKVIESESITESETPEKTENTEPLQKEPEQNEESEKAPATEEKQEIIRSEEPEIENEEKINFIWPALTGKIVKKFSSTSPKSDGIDLEFEKSTEIYAVADGKVIYSASNANFGNMVIIRHNDEFITVYAYLHTIFAKEGQALKQNDVIGIADKTEKKSTPSLHFEVRKAAKPTDPLHYLPKNASNTSAL